MIRAVHSESKTDTSTEHRLRKLSDRELLLRVQLVAQGERAMTINVLHHLKEIERRKLYLDLGYGSLFDYCIRRLKYSASAAGRRIQAARCIRRYPEVLELLHARELSLSTIALIEPILDDRNKAAILERVRGRSHREVERVASEYRPPIAFRDRVRPVCVPAPRSVDIDEALLDRELARLAPRAVTPGAGSGTRRITPRVTSRRRSVTRCSFETGVRARSSPVMEPVVAQSNRSRSTTSIPLLQVAPTTHRI